MASEVRITPSTGELKFQDNGSTPQAIRFIGLTPNQVQVIGDSASGGTPTPLATFLDTSDPAGSVFVPGSLGLSLGSSTLRWNLYGTNMNLTGTFTLGSGDGALYTSSGVVSVGTLPINRGGTGVTTFTDGILIKKATGSATLIPATPGSDYASSGYANLLLAPNTGTAPMRLQVTTDHVGTIEEWQNGSSIVAEVLADGTMHATGFVIGSNSVITSVGLISTSATATLYGDIVLKAGLNTDFTVSGGTITINSSAGESAITGSGVIGQVAYFDATEDITGSTNFIFDHTNVRLGLNVGAPATTLDVNGIFRLRAATTNGIDTTLAQTVSFVEATVAPVTAGYGSLLRLQGNGTTTSQVASRLELYGGANDSRLVYVGTGTSHVFAADLNNVPIIFRNGMTSDWSTQTDMLTLGIDGLVGVNTTNSAPALGQLHVRAAVASTTGLILEAAAEQSANLFETRTGTSDSRFTVNAQGIPELHPAQTSLANELRFFELAANGSDYVALRSPDALGTGETTVYVLPSSRPAVTEVLTAVSITGSLVTLGWAANGDGSGGSLPPGTDTQTLRWNGSIPEASSTLINTGLRIGVLTAIPAAYLHVSGNSTGVVTQIVESFSGQTADILQIQDGSDNAVLAHFDSGGNLGLPRGTVSAPGLHFGSDTDAGVFSIGVDSVSLVSSGVDRLRVLPSGNILVGLDSNTSPALPAADANANARFIKIYGGTDSYIQFNNGNGAGSNGYVGMSGGQMVITSSSGIAFGIDSEDSSTTPLTSTGTGMTLGGDGRLAINTGPFNARVSIAAEGSTQTGLWVVGSGGTGDIVRFQGFEFDVRMTVGPDGTELRFFETVENGGEYTGFKSPDSMDLSSSGGRLMYLLPTTAPTLNQTLFSTAPDGSGNATLFWGTPSGSGEPLPTGTNNQTVRFNSSGQLVATSTLINTGTQIGIGTTPTTIFEILDHEGSNDYHLRFQGNDTTGTFDIFNLSNNQGLRLAANSSAGEGGSGAYVNLYGDGNSTHPGEVIVGAGRQNAGFVTFQTWNGSIPVNRLQITAGATGFANFTNVKVGVGTVTPGAMVHAASTDPTYVALLAQAHISQTGSIFDIQTSDATSRVTVDADGNVLLHSGADSGDSTTEVRFFQRSSEGTEYVAIKAPALMVSGSTMTYILPDLQPLAGQVLSADAPSGSVAQLRWITASGGGGGGGGITTLAATSGISASPATITSSGTLSLDVTYSPTWTGVHAFTHIPTGVLQNTIRVTGSASSTGANHALIQVGDGGFSGSAFNFAGSANGTLLGFNAGSTFTGNMIDVQKAGTAGSDSYKLFAISNTGTVMLGYSGLGAPTGTGSTITGTSLVQPATTAGYRIVLYPNARGDGGQASAPSSIDYAIGVETGALWHASEQDYHWYSASGGGAQQIVMGLTGYAPCLTLYSANTFASEIRFMGTANSNYIGLRAPNNITANKSYILPSTDGTAGQVLSTNGSGVLSWITGSGGEGGGGSIGGSGTVGEIPLFATTTTLANSSLSQVSSTFSNDTIRHSSRAPRFQIVDSDTPGLTTGIRSENGGQVSDWGTNYTNLATRINSYAGGYTRFDLRVGNESSFWTIHDVAATSGTDTVIWSVDNTGQLTAGSIPPARLNAAVPVTLGGTGLTSIGDGQLIFGLSGAFNTVPEPSDPKPNYFLSWASVGGSVVPSWVLNPAGSGAPALNHTANGVMYVNASGDFATSADFTFTPGNTALNIRRETSDTSDILRIDNSSTQPRFKVGAGEIHSFYGVTGNGATVRLYQNDTESSANYVAWKSPASLSGNNTYVMPSAPPSSATQVLTAGVPDVNGVVLLSWSEPSSDAGTAGTTMPLYFTCTLIATTETNDQPSGSSVAVDLTNYTEWSLSYSKLALSLGTLQLYYYDGSAFHTMGTTISTTDPFGSTSWQSIPSGAQGPVYITCANTGASSRDDYSDTHLVDVSNVTVQFRGQKLGVMGPTGSTGAAGSNGNSVVWRGNFAPSTAYNLLDAVYSAGSSYICVLAYTSSSTAPAADATHWSLMVAAGSAAVGAAGQIQYSDGSGNLSAGADIVRNASGDLKISTGSTGTLRADDELVLREDGDTIGTSILRLQARSTLLGARLETSDATATYAELQLQYHGGTTRALRLEGRSGDLTMGGTEPEFQFGTAGSTFYAGLSSVGFYHTSGYIRSEGGYQASDGTAGASSTTGGLTFKNGLFTSGTLTSSVAIGGAIGGSPATGAVLYVDSSGDLAQDASNFFWDSTNHRLGIQVASGSFAVNVAADVHIGSLSSVGSLGAGGLLLTGTSAGVGFADRSSSSVGDIDAGTATYLAYNQSSLFRLKTIGNDVLTLTSTGRLRLGPCSGTAATAMLDVFPDATTTVGQIITGYAAGTADLSQWKVNPSGTTTTPLVVDSKGLLKFSTVTNSSPSQGEIWYDGTNLNFHNSSATVALTGSGGGTSMTSVVSSSVPASDTLGDLYYVTDDGAGAVVAGTGSGYYLLSRTKWAPLLSSTTANGWSYIYNDPGSTYTDNLDGSITLNSGSTSTNTDSLFSGTAVSGTIYNGKWTFKIPGPVSSQYSHAGFNRYSVGVGCSSTNKYAVVAFNANAAMQIIDFTSNFASVNAPTTTFNYWNTYSYNVHGQNAGSYYISNPMYVQVVFDGTQLIFQTSPDNVTWYNTYTYSTSPLGGPPDTAIAMVGNGNDPGASAQLKIYGVSVVINYG